MPTNPYKNAEQRMLRIRRVVHLVHEHDDGHYMTVCGMAFHRVGEAFLGIKRRMPGLCRECATKDSHKAPWGLDEPPVNPVEGKGKVATNIVPTRPRHKPRKRRDA